MLAGNCLCGSVAQTVIDKCTLRNSKLTRRVTPITYIPYAPVILATELHSAAPDRNN